MARLRRFAAAAGLAACLAAAVAAADSDPASRGAVRTLAADERGVVLRLDPRPFVTRVDEGGRTSIAIPGQGQLFEPGRPVLPRLRALVALPPGTTPRLVIGPDRPVEVAAPRLDRWAPAGSSFEAAPPTRAGAEGPGADLPWPAEPVRIAQVGRLRGHDVALLELYPVRWIERGETLLVHQGLDFEVIFEPLEGGPLAGPATVEPAGDPHFAGVAGGLVVNPAQLGPPRRDVGPGAGGGSSGTDSATAIDPVKLHVTARGMHRVLGSDLTAAGVNLAGIDPRNLVLKRDGVVVDIRVEGESDGVFDPADAIVFYGEGLDTRYTDTNVYWIESDVAAGPRMATRAVAPAGAAVTATFRNSVRKEQSKLYTSDTAQIPQPDEHWWWERLDDDPGTFPDSSDAYRATLSNLPVAGAQARLFFNVQGRSDWANVNPDRRTRLFLNGTLVDERETNGLALIEHDVLVDHTLLVEGENVVRLEVVRINGAGFSSVFTNWFSLEYDDTFTAESDALRFTLAPAGQQTLEVEGFGSDTLEAYDVSDPDHPVLLTGTAVVADAGTWTLRFEDGPLADATYETLAVAARLSPDAVILDTPSSWASSSNGADLIVVTVPEFSAEVQPLIDQRVAEGLRVVKVLVEDAMDEFSNGIYTPEGIRGLIDHAYDNWQAPPPAFVLLFGEANLDYRNYLGNGNDFVPTQMSPVFPGIGEVMTDNWYTRVDGADLLPDLYVGRATPRTAAEAQTIADKITAYSQTPPSAQVGDAVILVADDGQGTFDGTFQAISDDLAAIVPGAIAEHKIYAASFASNSAIKTEIRTRIDGGAVVTNYLGHGNRDIWGTKNGGSGRFWDIGELSTLANGTAQTFAVALNCVNGYFADLSATSMGEQWLRLAGKGAIGGWTPAGLGRVAEYEVLNEELFRRIFVTRDSRIGSAVFQSLITGYVVNGIGDDNMDELILFGDPSQHLATDEDQDGRLDHEEVAAGSNPVDADSDDDGLTDGAEVDFAQDTDGDGLRNFADVDSDDDGLNDGLEAGVTVPSAGTDTSAGAFVADSDPGTTTDPVDADSDGGGAPDGAEDRDADGAVDAGETDPNDALDDPLCAATAPAELTGLRVDKDGGDVRVTWDDYSGTDPCVLYRFYRSQGTGLPDSFSAFQDRGVLTQPEYVDRDALLDGVARYYLATGTSLAHGEGALGHYGR